MGSITGRIDDTELPVLLQLILTSKSFRRIGSASPPGLRPAISTGLGKTLLRSEKVSKSRRTDFIFPLEFLASFESPRLVRASHMTAKTRA